MNLLLQVFDLALRSLSVCTLRLKVICIDEYLWEEKTQPLVVLILYSLKVYKRLNAAECRDALRPQCSTNLLLQSLDSLLVSPPYVLHFSVQSLTLGHLLVK